MWGDVGGYGEIVREMSHLDLDRVEQLDVVIA